MMTRRQALQFAAGAPAVLRGASRKPGDKPNLLFLWTDEQRADTLRVYGNDRFRMPVLNRLASESVVFDRCYDTQPVCTPARSSVLTGQWPHANGCITNNIALRADTKTLPELLADSSYRTAYMGKWHLGDEVFAQHGFEQWVSMEDGYHEHFSKGRDASAKSSYHHFLAGCGYKPDSGSGRYSRGFAVRRKVEHCKPAFLAREAADFIGRHSAGPWLLHLNFLEPHMPFFGPYNDLHGDEEAPVPSNHQVVPEKEPERYRKSRQRYFEHGFEGHGLKTREGWQRLNRNYAGLCSQVDEAVGRILWALEASGTAENTIVVFTSDHGEMMGAHGLIGKGVFYEEAMRVPLLMRVPFRRQAHHVVRNPVSHIDLVPTLLDLMGAGRRAEGLPGHSLVGMMQGGKHPEDHVFSEWHTPPDGPDGRAVVSPDGWKLAVYDKDHSLLFNRERDPMEQTNLYYRPESREVVRRLRSRMEAWRKRTGDRLELPG